MISHPKGLQMLSPVLIDTCLDITDKQISRWVKWDFFSYQFLEIWNSAFFTFVDMSLKWPKK